MTKQFELRVGRQDDAGAMHVKDQLLKFAIDKGFQDITALCNGKRSGFREPIRQDGDKRTLAKSMIQVCLLSTITCIKILILIFHMPP